MRYKLIDNHTILQVGYIVDEVKGLITNASDEDFDATSPLQGKPLDETATIPTYDAATQELKTVYTETDTAIIKGYEVVGIVLSETDILKDRVNVIQNRVIDTETAVFGLMS